MDTLFRDLSLLTLEEERDRLDASDDDRFRTSRLQGYFEDLDILYSWWDRDDDVEAERKLLLAGDQPLTRDGSQKGKAPRLMVCHDFEGGYHDKHDARGYTFEHWHLVDTFIYFSHHRITIPPLPWIVAAQRHGTKILGTVIFEWEESAADLAKLLRGPARSSLPISGSPSFSPYFADRLIDLALQLSFSGWLINIETTLDLGLACSGEAWPPWVGEKARQRERRRNAERLRGWVAYLRSQGEARFEQVGRKGDWDVCWYDSVTYPDGKLQWQDALTDANVGFFSAASSLFTNYTWAKPVPDLPVPGAYPPHPIDDPLELQHAVSALTRTARAVDALGRGRSSVYVGIDVFARNCYGAHDTWRSLEMICPESDLQRKSSERSVTTLSIVPPIPSHLTVNALRKLRGSQGLSVSLFAPGYTWEHDPPSAPSTLVSLQPPRTWAQWFAEDLAFWQGHHPNAGEGGQPVSAYFQARPPPLPKGLEVLHRSASAPAFNHVKDSFFLCRVYLTNFALGSGGPAWFEHGAQGSKSTPRHDDDQNNAFLTGADPERAKRPNAIPGWTDVGATRPKPDLIWPSPRLQMARTGERDLKTTCEATLVQHDAWDGGVSVQIKIRALSQATLPSSEETSPTSTPTLRFLPICTVALPIVPSAALSLRVRACAIYKTTQSEFVQAVSVRPQQGNNIGVTEHVMLNNGWSKVVSCFSIVGPSIERSELGIILDAGQDGEVLVGELSIDVEGRE